MKIFTNIILLIFIFSCHESFSQVQGSYLLKVVNDENVGVHDAVVLIDTLHPMLSDENGYVYLDQSLDGERRIVIQHLSYAELDTVIIFPINTAKFILTLQSKTT